MSFERIMAIGGSGLNAQLVRMNATASNLANVGVVSGSAETAFRAQRPVFSALLTGETAGGFKDLAGGVRVARIVTDTNQSNKYMSQATHWLTRMDMYFHRTSAK